MADNRNPSSKLPAQEEEKKVSQNETSHDEDPLGDGNNPEHHSAYDNYSARNFN